MWVKGVGDAASTMLVSTTDPRATAYSLHGESVWAGGVGHRCRRRVWVTGLKDVSTVGEGCGCGAGPASPCLHQP